MSKPLIPLVTAILFVAVIVLVLLEQISSNKPNLPTSNSVSSIDCPTSIKPETVSGDSLTPFINNGTEVTAIYGYYACHEVTRGDVILYDYSGDKNPLIKIVYGIPGDSFSVREINGGWNIVINGGVLKNKENTPYLIDNSGTRMINLYVDSYKGVIPPDSYLILGDNPNGSLDSTAFGLIAKSNILAKATY
ncbi:MAG: signal peptidase I [Patescibacteria group bacterium]|nr:signal peptidase I [Patescibacteria group bacterium]